MVYGRPLPSYEIDVLSPFGRVAELSPRNELQVIDDVKFVVIADGAAKLVHGRAHLHCCIAFGRTHIDTFPGKLRFLLEEGLILAGSPVQLAAFDGFQIDFSTQLILKASQPA